MNNNTIIVYRSQSEAYADQFNQEVLLPWIYNHRWEIFGIMALVVMVAIVTDYKRK
jgi:hypothetical protein